MLKLLGKLQTQKSTITNIIFSKNTQLLSSLTIKNLPIAFFSKKKNKHLAEELTSKRSSSIDSDSLKNFSGDVDELQSDMSLGDDFKMEEKKEVQESSPEKITSKILCDIIGSKHYPSNEEITIPKDNVVAVYDENDKLLGNMFLSQALDNAYALDKDIVLRNDKVSPPIVKMMKYRVELLKRLFKKLGKNMGKEFNAEKTIEHKVFGFTLKTDKKDFESKLDKLRELLTLNSYVKVVIPINWDSNDDIVKANSILKNVASELTSLAKIRAGPLKQKKQKEMMKSLDPSVTDSYEELAHHDNVIKDAYEAAAVTQIESEKDLDYVDSVYIELESLMVDNLGIDYEKLLKTTNFDTLVRGMTHTNLLGEISQASKEGGNQINIENKIIEGINNFSTEMSFNPSLKKQLKMLEKEAVVQHDYKKRIQIQDKIDKMKEEIFETNLIYSAKILKNSVMELTFKSAKKEGILDRNKLE